MDRLLKGLFRELLIFITVYGCWLAYVLVSHHYIEPVQLDSQSIMISMLYQAFLTYLFLAAVRTTIRLFDQRN